MSGRRRAKRFFAVSTDPFRKLPQAVPGKKKGKCFPGTSCVTVRGFFFFFCQNSIFCWYLRPRALRGAGCGPARREKQSSGVQGAMASKGSRASLAVVLGGNTVPPVPACDPPGSCAALTPAPAAGRCSALRAPAEAPPPAPARPPKPRPSRPQAPPQGGPRHRLRLAGSRLRHPSTAPPQLTSFDWAAPTASQRRARRLLGVVDGSGAPPASCGLWRPLIGGGGSGPLPSRLGRGRCLAARGSAPPSPWAPATTSTTTSSKVPPPAAGRAAPRRTAAAAPLCGLRGGAGPGPARPGRPRGPGAAAAAFVARGGLAGSARPPPAAAGPGAGLRKGEPPAGLPRPAAAGVARRQPGGRDSPGGRAGSEAPGGGGRLRAWAGGWRGGGLRAVVAAVRRSPPASSRS